MGGPSGQEVTQTGTTTQEVQAPAFASDINQQVAQAKQLAQGVTAPQLQTGFGQFAPNLVDPAALQMPTALDPRSQALVSQGRQAVARQGQQRQRAIGQQFGRTQPGVAGVLRQGNQLDQLLAQSPLQFQAAGDQRQRQIQEAQFGLQRNELLNRMRLAGGQEQARLQQMGNQAMMQQFGLGQAPLQAQQNLIQLLASLTPVFGQTQTTQVGTGMQNV